MKSIWKYLRIVIFGFQHFKKMKFENFVEFEHALRGALTAGREKEEELSTTSLEFEFHLQFPCGSPSTDLSDLRQSARSSNDSERKQTFNNTCQGLWRQTVAIAANPNFASTFSMQIFKFQRLILVASSSSFFRPAAKAPPELAQGAQKRWDVYTQVTLSAQPFLFLLDFGVKEKDSPWPRVRSLLSTLCILLRDRFEPRRIISALGTAGSLMTIGLSLNMLCTGINQYGVRKQDWRVQKFVLRRPQRWKAIQGELPFLPSTQEDKIRLCSQGAPRHSTFKPYCPSV